MYYCYDSKKIDVFCFDREILLKDQEDKLGSIKENVQRLEDERTELVAKVNINGLAVINEICSETTSVLC